MPIQRIKAHNAKIYGIDWAHDRRNELVTCSLDKTIKIWDTQTATPNIEIKTSYPVWRARDLPFGQGVLSLPQRGETALEMYVHEDPTLPIEKFEGHSDVVKEFVWRQGGVGQSHLPTSISTTLSFPRRQRRVSTHHLVEGQDPAVLACRYGDDPGIPLRDLIRRFELTLPSTESRYDSYTDDNYGSQPERLQNLVQQSTNRQRPPSYTIRPYWLPRNPG